MTNIIYEYLLKLVILPIKIYQFLISPILGNNCRYTPTCSSYMVEALKEWGIFKGLYLGTKRIIRCNPWGGMGDDPVPKNNKKC